MALFLIRASNSTKTSVFSVVLKRKLEHTFIYDHVFHVCSTITYVTFEKRISTTYVHEPLAHIPLFRQTEPFLSSSQENRHAIETSGRVEVESILFELVGNPQEGLQVVQNLMRTFNGVQNSIHLSHFSFLIVQN